MKRLVVLTVLVLSCGEKPPPVDTTPLGWKLDKRHTILPGPELEPTTTDSVDPGPSAIVVANGKLWITYANLSIYQPAGPGWLAVHDAETLEREALIRLDSPAVRCHNPVALTQDGNSLFAVCSGTTSFDESNPSHDGALIEVSMSARSVTRSAAVGNTPGGVAVAGDDLWLSDGENRGLSHVKKSTFAVLAGANGDGLISVCQTGGGKRGYAADVATFSGRTFASCFADDTVQEFDPVTGSKVGDPIAVGSGPNRLTVVEDALYVLNSLGGTLSRVTAAGPTKEFAFLGRTKPDGTLEGGNDPQGLAGTSKFVGVTNSGYGTFVVLDVTSGAVLKDAIDLKASADAPSNFPTSVVFAGQSFFVIVPGWEPGTNKVPSEIIKLGPKS